MTFEIKKITSETLGEYLQEARAHFGLSLSEVAHRAVIKVEYLGYLEQGLLQKLPPDVYVFGFLRKLAHFYCIDADDLIRQYKIERAVLDTQGAPVQVTRVSFKQVFERIIVTPKVVSIALVFAVVLFTVGYIVVQVVSLNGSPKLKIKEPLSGQMVSGSFVHVEGETDPGVTLKINDQAVFVDSNGVFDATIGVIPGQKELQVNAQNKFGKVSEQKLQMIVHDGVAPEVLGDSTLAADGLDLELQFTDATTISLVVDGTSFPAEQIEKGGSKTVYAHDKVLLTTSNAGVTRVVLNGKSLGALGKNGEILKDVPFLSGIGN